MIIKGREWEIEFNETEFLNNSRMKNLTGNELQIEINKDLIVFRRN
jgi:hypothetical protein